MLIYQKSNSKTLKILYSKKVECMSHKELEQYVREIISHQINDTIDKEEEMEAWKEMANFYGDQFETIVLEIKKKYATDESLENFEEHNQERRLELLEKNSIEKAKKDMWDD